MSDLADDLVLIETLWNVKVKQHDHAMDAVRYVLIETLWNVKSACLHYGSGLLYCINRNIVECKDCKQQIVACGKSVLIETLWNVKEAKLADQIKTRFVLIETLWNVKLINSTSQSISVS